MSVYELDGPQIHHGAILIQKIQNTRLFTDDVINMNTEQKNYVECSLENQEFLFFFFFSAPGLNLKETELELEFCVGTKKKSVVLAR